MKISVGEKIGYGIGDIASNFIWGMIMFFLPIFYTDTFGLPAAVVGTMFIVVRLFDAINDPIMGTIADRTNTRWGKYRPYLLWMAIPYGLGGILMFLTPNFDLTGKIIYAYTTYIIMMIIYTAIMVPYNSLSGVITSDVLERTSLNSYRFIGAFIGALFIQGLALYLVDRTGNDNESIIQANIVDDQLVIREAGPGTAKLTLSATDNHDATSNQEFLVKVNLPGINPPELIKPIENIQLDEGFKKYDLDLSNVFKDVDGNDIALSASSSARKIVAVSVQGNKLTLQEAGFGRAKVTVTATNSKGSTNTATFYTDVIKKGNQAPVINREISNIELENKFIKRKLNIKKALGLYDEYEIGLENRFKDPNGDELFYKVSSANTDVATATIFNSSLLLKKKSSGTAQITLTADDNHGGQSSMVFSFTINPSESGGPILMKEIDNINLEAGFGKYHVDLAGVFKDNKGGSLVYTLKVNNDSKGYVKTMIIFSLFSVLLFVITFVFTKERIKPIANEKTPLKDDFKDLMKNRPWMILFLVTLVTLMYGAIRGASIAYYFRYFVGDLSLVGIYLVSGSVTIILMLMATKWLTKVFGKRVLYIICMLFVSASLFGYHFLSPNQIIWIFALQILQSIGSAPTMPLLWSMYADTADYSEWKTGRKAMGLAYSASSFALKAGIALGGAIALWLLAYFGYQPNVEQSESSLYGMRLMMGIYPAVGALVCAILIWFYSLDTKTMKTVEEELNFRRDND